MPADVGLMVCDETHSCNGWPPSFDGVQIITSHTKGEFTHGLCSEVWQTKQNWLFIGAMPELFIYIPICLNGERSQGLNEIEWVQHEGNHLMNVTSIKQMGLELHNSWKCNDYNIEVSLLQWHPASIQS